MRSDRPEVADIIRRVLPKVSCYFSPDKKRVLEALISCRTSVLGGHLLRCKGCGHREQGYNSCWNRHCPKCQGGAAFDWVSERSEELLPVPYFHVVFTLPSPLRRVCYQNKAEVYRLIFRASSEALCDAIKSRHNAKPGFFGVLHSWNQELLYHPHVHHVVPGIGISLDGKKVVQLGQEKFLVPVRVLSKLFRGKFIDYLKRAYRKGKLSFFGSLEYLKDPRAFEHLISKSAVHDWVVYCKRPFAGPACVLKYLASYTHRVGISNSRLRSVTDFQVTFSARNPKRKGKKRLIKINPTEFLRRFLLHIIPKGFRRIRYFGFMLNEKRQSNLAFIRKHLPSHDIPTIPERLALPCPVCQIATLVLIAVVKPHRLTTLASASPIMDST